MDLFTETNRIPQSPTLCIRTTKGISTVGGISVLSTTPITPLRTPKSTTRRLLARLRNFRDEDDEQRGRQTEVARSRRRGNSVKGKSRSDGSTLPSRIPTFASAVKSSILSNTPDPTPRSLQVTRPSPIHSVSDLVFDPFYHTKLVLGMPGEVHTSKRPGPLARAPTLEGVDEVDEREEEPPVPMDDDFDADEDLEANTLLWYPPPPIMLPPPIPEAPAYHHYEDDFPMHDDRNINQATTPSFNGQFRSLDVDMDDDGFGDHQYDSDGSEGSSMDAQIDVVEEDSDDEEFDDAAMSTSRFLHRTAYESILTSTVHQYLGYMEDGGRVTLDDPMDYSEDGLGMAGRSIRRRRVRRSITYPRRFSSLMGVSLAIMKDKIGVSTGF
ncbi:hypothetical protein CPB83DRAFT_570247 [Crepidotus variabilis]|uniref:Uncharacterized protein n=1 Tax=Crepidotus variabilis TaxID=179855 RepID=A0A9P6E9L0_9AGAR|nr:hypothetical protein CPB83DRAFT_570247 [Crepidotus variabilis]